jgi:hypothetical protein
MWLFTGTTRLVPVVSVPHRFTFDDWTQSTGGGIPNCQRAQVSDRRKTSSVRLSRTGDREPEDGAIPSPEKFNTFNTFTVFAIIDPAFAYSTLIHRQAPHAPSLSQRTIPTTLPPSCKRLDGPGTREVVGGKGVGEKR